MDELFVVIAIVCGIFSIASSAKKKRGEAKRASPDARRAQPMRPMDVDLPGQQATMPIHWEGTAANEGMTHESMPLPAEAQSDGFTRALRTEYEALYAAYEPQEQSTMRLVNEESQAIPVTIPGIDLRLDGDMLVKGVIFSEILNRKPIRRT